jgi:glycosyltransferase involved in cell wall biosynthesis
VRLAVYTDYEYRSDGVRRYGQRAFVVFLEMLRDQVDRLVLVGRLDPEPGTSHYPLHEDTELVGLPHYTSLTEPLSVARSMVLSVMRFWRMLDEVDVVWSLGPYPHAIALALLTILRRRRLVLGVRQDMPAYVRSRRPDRRWMHVGADVMEFVWKLLARRYPVIVVGPELARQYRGACRTLPITVSLVSEQDVVDLDDALSRSYEDELTLLTVGRLDAEKNPLLLADVLALLRAGGRSWRLIVVGEGQLREKLLDRLDELGLGGHADLHGYMAFHEGLLDLYRSSHAFLHVSLTEGFPQVLVEAFASGLPAVATAVGGVPAAAEGAALLIPADDARAAAHELERIAEDADLRRKLITAGLERARHATLEMAVRGVVQFLASASSSQPDARDSLSR